MTSELYGGLTLRKGDRDPQADQPPTYAGVPQKDLQAASYVADLQRDLANLGFLLAITRDNGLVSVPSGVLDELTEWAIREFQIYAQMDKVATFKDPDTRTFNVISDPSGSFPLESTDVTNLESVRNGFRLAWPTTGFFSASQPVNGVVDSLTRRAIQFWKENDYRCPVVVQAYEMTNSQGQWVRAQDHPIKDGENIWHFDQVKKPHPIHVCNPACVQTWMWVRDFTGYYKDGFSDGRSPDDLICLGEWTSRDMGGPVLLQPKIRPGESWDECTVTPQNLVGASSLESGPQLSTYKVVEILAKVECGGRFDSVNAYDRGVESVGLYHWTIALLEGGSAKPGELAAYLALLQETDRTAFRRAIGFFGIAPVRSWNRAGNALFDVRADDPEAGRRAKYTSRIQFRRGDSTEVLAGSPDANYLRSWHWFYRFVMAARTVDGFKHGMWKMARMRLRDLRDIPFPQAGPIILDSETTRIVRWGTDLTEELLKNVPGPERHGEFSGAALGDSFTSEKAVALLLRWHVNWTEAIIEDGCAGGKLNDVLDIARSKISLPKSPLQWETEHQRELVAGIRKLITDKYNWLLQEFGFPPSPNAPTDYWTWWNLFTSCDPIWNADNLSDERNTFALDVSALPPRPRTDLWPPQAPRRVYES